MILVEPELLQSLNPSLLRPGQHAVIITRQPWSNSILKARGADLELRDTLLIVLAGVIVPITKFAFLFRKPSDKSSLIEQALANPVTGLNIGGSRVGSGRWPSNVLLVHGQACSRSGTRQVPSGVAHRTTSGGKNFGSDLSKPALPDMTYADTETGLETIDAWNCQRGCPVKILDEQSGERPSTLTGRADPNFQHENPGDNHGSSLFGGGNSNVYADVGGASRFYPQFKNENALLLWLARLIDL